MKRFEHGFRQIVAYTIGGVAMLAFALFLRALFMVQSQPSADSPVGTPTPLPLDTLQPPFPSPTP